MALNKYRGKGYGSDGIIPPDQGIYETSSTQKAPMGFKLEMNDGRIFRYCKAGASNLTAGYINQGPALNQYDEDCVVYVAAAVGDDHIHLTNHASGAAKTQDCLADGFITVSAGSNQLGRTYKIKGNSAAAAAGELIVYLYDPLITAISTTSTVTFAYCPYVGVVVEAATNRPMVANIIPVTANYYFWGQSRGICGVISSGTITAGDDLQVASGAVAVIAETTESRVGMALVAGDSGDSCLVWLELE